MDYSAKRSFVENGLILSCLRGWDATGIATVKNADKPPEVYKKAMPSPDFVNIKRTQRILDGVDEYLAVLGHTRSATMKGSTSDENAHPFQFDHITMIHNGHIPNYKSLKADCDVEVDSAHVAASIAQNGEAWTLDRINGEYTLIWHNSQDKTINIAKNQGRPIHYARIPAWGGYVFASEFGMLAMLLDRHNIKIDDKIWRPADLMHFKYDLDTLDGTMYPFLRPPTKYHGPPTRNTSAATHSSTMNSTDIPTRRRKQRLGQTSSSSTSYYGSERMSGRGVVSTSNGQRTGIDRDLISRVVLSSSQRLLKNAQDSVEDMVLAQEMKAAKRLNSFNLKFGLPYGVDFVDWVPYKDYGDHPFGTVVGVLTGSQFKGQICEVPCITDTEYEAVDELGRFVQCAAWNVKSFVKSSKDRDDTRVIVMKVDDDVLGRLYREYEIEKERKKSPSNSKALVVLPAPTKELAKDGMPQPRELSEPDTESAGTGAVYHGPKGSWITMQRWVELTRDGCSYHQCKLNISQHRQIYWIDDCPICPTCANDNHEELLIPNAQFSAQSAR